MKREHLIHSAITDGPECICNPEILVGSNFGSWNLQKKVSPKGTLLDLNATWELFTGKQDFLESKFNRKIHEQQEIGEDGTVYEKGDITYTLIDGNGNLTKASFTIKNGNKVITGVEYDDHNLILFFSSSHKKDLGDVYPWIRPVLDQNGNPVMEDGIPLIYDYVQIPVQTIFEDYETQALFPWYADEQNIVRLRSSLEHSDKKLGRFAITDYSEVFYAQDPSSTSDVYLTSLPLYIRELHSDIGTIYTETEVEVGNLGKVKRVSGSNLYDQLGSTSLVQAIKEDRTKINSLQDQITNLKNNEIGNFSEIQTDATLVDSINALLLKTNINRNKIGFENGDWKELSTQNKGDLITSINEINSNLNTLSENVSINDSNHTREINTLESSIQTLQNDLNQKDSKIENLKTLVGNTINLTTENKNTIVEAINELKTSIDNIEISTIDNIESLNQALNLDSRFNNKADKSIKIISNRYISEDSSVQEQEIQNISNDITLDLFNSFGFDKSKYQLKNEKGQPNGYVPLNNDGLISSQYLPSYIDTIIDVYADYTIDTSGNISNISLYSDSTKTQQLTEGNIGTIYADKDSSLQFRWTGTRFISISSSTLTLGTVSGTAYDGGKGNSLEESLEDHLKSGTEIHNDIVYNPNPHNVTPGQLLLQNIAVEEGVTLEEINVEYAIKNIYSRLNTVEGQANLNTAHIGSMSNIEEDSVTAAIGKFKPLSQTQITNSISTYLVYGKN